MNAPDPSPTDAALARLGKLAASGAPPERVAQEVGEMIAAWAEEDGMDAAAARDRVELLWDSVSKDAADLEEAINDAEGDTSRGGAPDLANARRALAAMQAAVATLAAAHGRL